MYKRSSACEILIYYAAILSFWKVKRVGGDDNELLFDIRVTSSWYKSRQLQVCLIEPISIIQLHIM